MFPQTESETRSSLPISSGRDYVDHCRNKLNKIIKKKNINDKKIKELKTIIDELEYEFNNIELNMNQIKDNIKQDMSQISSSSKMIQESSVEIRKLLNNISSTIEKLNDDNQYCGNI